MRYLLLLMFLAGCSTTPVPSRLNPGQPPISIPVFSQSRSEVLPPPVTTMNLMWNYPLTMPASDDNGFILFEVDQSSDMLNWQPFCITNQCPVPFSLTNGAGFFKVSSFYE